VCGLRLAPDYRTFWTARPDALVRLRPAELEQLSGLGAGVWEGNTESRGQSVCHVGNQLAHVEPQLAPLKH
jgi:hypothetical protein